MNLADIPGANLFNADTARAEAIWLEVARRDGVEAWLDNARGPVMTVPLGQGLAPVTCAHDASDTSYVASLISGWCRYAVVEAVRRLPARAEVLPRLAQAPLIGWMRAARLHHAALLDNWLVSTNLRPDLPGAAWRSALEAQIAQAPGRPVAIRNVCDAVNPGVCAELRNQGWLMVPARLIYCCDPKQPQLWRRNHVRKDRRLLEDAQFEWEAASKLGMHDLPELRRNFRKVFIDKHSALNPDFSDDYFRHCLRTGFLDLHGLRYQGRWVGVLAVLQRAGWLTTPLIGYDTELPQELAIYRRLMARLLDLARQRDCRLHYSSGAGSFKQARGGEASLEYTALYVRHLARPIRLAAETFAASLDRLASPLLTRYG